MTVPKHIQAADIIRAQIADGTLKPGSPAPNILRDQLTARPATADAGI